MVAYTKLWTTINKYAVKQYHLFPNIYKSGIVKSHEKLTVY